MTDAAGFWVSAWEWVKKTTLVAWSWIKKGVRALAVPLLVTLVFGVALIMISAGIKNVRIGGLLDKLLGRDSKGTKAVDVANGIPEGRVGKDGNLIPIGEPDGKGITQARVVEVDAGGLFDRNDQVKITSPDSPDPIVIDLPEGVTASDVDKVLVVRPEVFVVTVKSTSPVSAADVDDLLRKYGE